jgi:hypothetical protein
MQGTSISSRLGYRTSPPASRGLSDCRNAHSQSSEPNKHLPDSSDHFPVFRFAMINPIPISFLRRSQPPRKTERGQL